MPRIPCHQLPINRLVQPLLHSLRRWVRSIRLLVGYTSVGGSTEGDRDSGEREGQKCRHRSCQRSCHSHELTHHCSLGPVGFKLKHPACDCLPPFILLCPPFIPLDPLSTFAQPNVHYLATSNRGATTRCPDVDATDAHLLPLPDVI